MNWSQDFTVKSNARRSAKKAGVDPAKVASFVKAGKTLFRFPLADTNGLRRMAAEDKAKTGKAKRTKAAPPKATLKRAASAGFAASRPDKPTKTAEAKTTRSGGKFDQVATLLRRPGGASMTEIVKATGWKPHSARARISVDVSKLLGKGEVIDRRREAGVSHYAIVKSKQMDLPIGEA